MAEYRTRSRTIISVLVIGLASLFLIVRQGDVALSELRSVVVSILLMLLLIVALAAVMVLVFKGLARLLRGRDDSDGGPTV